MASRPFSIYLPPISMNEIGDEIGERGGAVSTRNPFSSPFSFTDSLA